jgi:hypothetical protein
MLTKKHLSISEKQKKKVMLNKIIFFFFIFDRVYKMSKMELTDLQAWFSLTNILKVK